MRLPTNLLPSSFSFLKLPLSLNVRSLPLFLAVLIVGSILLSQQLRAAPARILLTADTEAHLDVCRSCPGQQGRGGIARRAAKVRELRKKHDQLLLLDSGNFLFGGSLPIENSRISVQAYNRMKYDAVNVSYRDFRRGPEVTKELLNDAGFTPLSANLYDGAGEKRLFSPYKTLSIGDTAYGVIGLTQLPSGLSTLPHLNKQLSDVTIRDPTDSLKKILNKLEDQVDRILVLYYGSAPALARLHRTVGERVDLFLIGGTADPAQKARKGGIPFMTAPSHGTGLEALTLAEKPPPIRPWNASTVPIKSSIKPDPDVHKLVAEPLRELEKQREQLAGKSIERDRIPAKPELGKRHVIYRTGTNRGLRITITDLQFLTSYGGEKAGPNEQFLLMSSEWENKIELEVLEADIQPQTGVLGITKRLFMTVNGHRLVRLHPRLKELPDMIPTSFVLKQPGSLGSGKLLFTLPDVPLNSMTLHFFHERWGPIRVPLKSPETSAEKTTPPDPETKWKSNKVVKLASFGHRTTTSIAGNKAPEGMEYLVVNLGGMSRLTVDTEAVAVRKNLDSKKERKKMIPIGKPLPHAYAPQMIQAVVDGEHTFLPRWDLGTFPDVPVFFPDRLILGDVVFLVPKKRTSLSTRILFPTLKLPGRRGGQKRLSGLKHLRLDLEGTYKKPKPRKAIAAIRDKPVAVGIMNSQRTETYRGQQPASGKTFLVLNVSLKHSGEGKGGMYSFEGRCKLEGTGAGTLSPHDLSYRYGHPPRGKFYVPSGKRQSFDLVFEIPSDATDGTLTYKGIKEFAKVNLTFK